VKKIAYIFIFTLGITLFINLIPQVLDGVLFGFVPNILIFFLVPLASGLALVLVQNKNRSYEFLPILLAGSFINGVTIVLISVLDIFLSEYLRHDYSYGPSLNSSGLLAGLLGIFLPFLALSLFGGLFGLVIRGATLVVKKSTIK
jgi:hypothetical protein